MYRYNSPELEADGKAIMRLTFRLSLSVEL